MEPPQPATAGNVPCGAGTNGDCRASFTRQQSGQAKGQPDDRESSSRDRDDAPEPGDRGAVRHASASPRLDRSGAAQVGQASVYGPEFQGRKTAGGTTMDQHSDVAASKTLPIGTVAQVTNLQNGKSATVRVEDRGPFVKGRIVDLSQTAAEKLDVNKKGVVPVVVKPISVPQPDGTKEPGAAAVETSTSAGP